MQITADISWPGIEPNKRDLLASLGQSLAGLAFQNYEAVAQGFASALGSFQQGEPSLAQQVGRWWRSVGYMALTTSLADARFGLSLSPDECRTHALKHIDDLLDCRQFVLDATGWRDPSCSDFAKTLLEGFPSQLARLHSDTSLTDEQQCHVLREAFYRAARWMQVHESALTSAVEACLFSQQADADRLRQSLARHGRWIDKLYFHDPVFGEDLKGRNGTPLAHLYVPPRGYCRVALKVKDGDKLRYKADCQYLEPAMMAWLDQSKQGIKNGEAHAHARVRVLAGGPGCGKSSFARYFATQVMRLHSDWQSVFVSLHHFRETGDLSDGLKAHLNRLMEVGDGPCEGIESGALSPNDRDKPMLLIFDGLDELHSNQHTSHAVTQDFIDRLMFALGSSVKNACALVLGRPVAVSQAADKAKLGPESVWYFLPARRLEKDDFKAELFGVDQLPDPLPFGDADDPRLRYWRKWAKVNGFDTQQDRPKGLLHPSLDALTGEPLLLHMLALASRYGQENDEPDYLGADFPKIADNRNRLYQQLFTQVLQRDVDRRDGGPPITTDSDKAFELLQCLGLAAWRESGGRWGRSSCFDDVLPLRFGKKKAKTLKQETIANIASIATLFYTNVEAEEQARKFEFLHKSFGEYLATKGLFQVASRLGKKLETDDGDEENFAKDWLKLVCFGTLTHEVLDWINCEAALMAEQDLDALAKLKQQLNQVFVWVQKHGFPVHRVVRDDEDWHKLTQRHTCAEIMLLALLQACARALLAHGHENARWHLPQWNDLAFDILVHRLFTANAKGPARQLFAAANLQRQFCAEANLRSINFRGSDLTRADLFGAKLEGANLEGANLEGAKLEGANLREANLRGANLLGANLLGANLEGAKLEGAKLEGANLRDCLMPDGKRYDPSYHTETMMREIFDVRDC